MWVKVGVVAGVIAALAAVFAVFRSTTSQGGRHNCNVSGSGNEVVCQGSGETTEERVIAEAERFKDNDPEGQGPWGFVVVRDMNIGLKVRTTPTVDGIHIGGLAHLHTAWVICKKHSGFDPEGNGDLWYQLKWSHQQPSTAYFESETAAKATGWAHSYYLVPVNHNGNVPDC